MWPTITIILIAALLAVHLVWRKRFLNARKTWLADSARRASIEMVTASEARARQDALLDSMIEGVLVLDESNRVQFANRAFAQMFATVGMLQGKPVAEAVRVPEVAEIVKRTDYEGRVIDHELRMPGGPERWLQISAAAISSVERRRLGTVLVFHDLTRTKRLERTREEFVANVSHELRTPLSLIKGYTETLLDGAKDNQEVSTRFLQTIARNAERLKLLIEDLLTISELESGRVTLNIQTMDLCELVDKVVEDFKTRASGRNVILVNDVPEMSVRGDSIRLEQVFSNLVDNAIKYGRQGGRVNIGAIKAGVDKVEVFVKDDGPGLPAESLERVFERFYRVDKARSREQGGTGLGLSIVKHIVQSHGGRVWARSEPGQGATFFFTVPGA